ncbi:FAD/FMN-containing dehydrogenase [Nonlabens dokdonensis]|uniref:FAD binding oxidoreductase n=2 Tax=Nonlabens dokdonensis TaxID=328515 RepID=L7WF31_NONDD|nr:FAD-binding oxidoreductase [Nonlabens dokdonensis]AGC77498.1 FAD binding oxidoreductase [Nonlabens dokdonensis DSW-6]PZX39946.1 FAD/FMN-containing dehydrogenase [Nonlabens dokdonensis]
MNPSQLFNSFLEEGQILTDKALEQRYHHIWHMDEPLKALCVLLPKNTEQVSKIMKVCYQNDLPVVTHGGLTNLVGSTETIGNEVVISTERLNRIEEIDKASRTITVQSGVILENIHNATEEEGLLFPLNFGARGSAQIGGIVSTNAGGLRVLKYGMTRQLVLGLEAVTVEGTVISSMKKIIKDNSAYDLKQLFIGSEGTLGIITKVILKLEELPKSRNAAFIGFDNYDAVVTFLKYCDSKLAGKLSGFELIWKNSYVQMTSVNESVRPPLPYDYNYYVLIESLGGNQFNDQNEFQNLLEQALEEELILDAVMANSQSDVEWFFRIREDVNNLVDFMEHDQHFDISLPIPYIGSYIEERYNSLRKIKGVNQVYAFGHVADGNIHFMVGKSNLSTELKKRIDHCIYDGLQKIGGSVSAEHGIGLHKKDYLHLCRNEEEINLMRLLKTTMDPKGLLNPRKIL